MLVLKNKKKAVAKQDSIQLIETKNSDSDLRRGDGNRNFNNRKVTNEENEFIPWVPQLPDTDKPVEDNKDQILKELDGLNQIDYLQITQNLETDMKYCSQINTYWVQNRYGEVVYISEESTSCFCRQLCGPNRTFKINFSQRDAFLFNIDRNGVGCDGYLIFCQPFLHKLDVSASNGFSIGYVQQIWSPLQLELKVYESKDLIELIESKKTKEPETVEDDEYEENEDIQNRVEDVDQYLAFRIYGAYCPCRCCKDMNFIIMDRLNKKKLGEINKVWLGPSGDDFNWDHENFEISFPIGLKSYHKALLIGAAYLINYMYFEMA